MESAYFYFDGTYRGRYDRDNLGSTSGLMHFGSGLHSITFYLKDGYGNVTRETRYFTVAAEETDVPGVSLDLRGEPTLGKTWQLALTATDRPPSPPSAPMSPFPAAIPSPASPSRRALPVRMTMTPPRARGLPNRARSRPMWAPLRTISAARRDSN